MPKAMAVVRGRDVEPGLVAALRAMVIALGSRALELRSGPEPRELLRRSGATEDRVGSTSEHDDAERRCPDRGTCTPRAPRGIVRRFTRKSSRVSKALSNHTEKRIVDDRLLARNAIAPAASASPRSTLALSMIAGSVASARACALRDRDRRAWACPRRSRRARTSRGGAARPTRAHSPPR
jgi:hypothetical protein